VEKISQWGLS